MGDSTGFVVNPLETLFQCLQPTQVESEVAVFRLSEAVLTDIGEGFADGADPVEEDVDQLQAARRREELELAEFGLKHETPFRHLDEIFRTKFLSVPL